MNKITIIGNLTKVPELKQVGNDNLSFCRFTVAVNDKFNRDKVDYFNVVAWRGLADTCNKYLSKGQKVCVVGKMESGTYEKDGEKVAYWQLVAEEVEFIGAKQNNENMGENSAEKRHKVNPTEMKPITEDELPF